jgi:hypothetical protein
VSQVSPSGCENKILFTLYLSHSRHMFKESKADLEVPLTQTAHGVQDGHIPSKME